jgi:putative hydrolase
MHVHSTFSDGRGTIAENVAEAERMGVRRMTCVDHVRESTEWVPEFVAGVAEARAETDVELLCGIEAKLLDTSGRLDLPAPELIEGVDRIYAADHQVPMVDGPHHPAQIRERIDKGDLDPVEVLEAIVASTAAAITNHDNVVIAHLFSVLPKIGIDEADVPTELLEQLADAAVRGEARIEVDERWSCPSARTVASFVSRGVPLLFSTDSHRPGTIARYAHCASVRAAVADLAPTNGGSTSTQSREPAGQD